MKEKINVTITYLIIKKSVILNPDFVIGLTDAKGCFSIIKKNKYPLIGTKYLDFMYFKEAFHIFVAKEHLKKEGLNKLYLKKKV